MLDETQPIAGGEDGLPCGGIPGAIAYHASPRRAVFTATSHIWGGM